MIGLEWGFSMRKLTLCRYLRLLTSIGISYSDFVNDSDIFMSPVTI